MRLILLPFALVLAGQAHAQDRAPLRAADAQRIGEALSDPTVQAGIAGLVGAFADAVLDTRVGPLARYADPADQIRAQESLGDIVRRHDPSFDRNLRQDTRRAVATLGQASKDGAAVAAELSQTTERLRTLLQGTAALVKAYGHDRSED